MVFPEKSNKYALSRRSALFFHCFFFVAVVVLRRKLLRLPLIYFLHKSNSNNKRRRRYSWLLQVEIENGWNFLVVSSFSSTTVRSILWWVRIQWVRLGDGLKIWSPRKARCRCLSSFQEFSYWLCLFPSEGYSSSVIAGDFQRGE